MSNVVHDYDFEPKKSSWGKNLLIYAFGAASALGFVYRDDIKVWAEKQFSTGPKTEEQTNPYADGVDRQKVTTVFLNTDPRRDAFTWKQEQMPAISQEVQGYFPKDQAYKVRLAVYGSEKRRHTALITLTSAEDDIIRMNGKGEWQVAVPEDAPRVSFADMDPALRDNLRILFIGLREAMPAFAAVHRNSLPAGLVDTAAYPEPDAHGYSLQFWDNRANGPAERGYYRDTEGLIAEGQWIAGREMVTDYVVREEGKIGHVRADFEPFQYENDPDIDDPRYFRTIESMTQQERDAFKAQALVYGIAFGDETIDSYVRDPNGKIIATDRTRTFFQSSKGDISATRHSYVFVDLSGDEKMIRRISRVSFDSPLSGNNDAPAFVESPDGKVTIGGKEAAVDRDYRGYDIENIDNRFRMHGRKSHLPAKARDYYPLGRG